MPYEKPIHLRACQGRLRVKLRAQRMGRDLFVLLFGGDAHIGATALAAPGCPEIPPLCVPGHKEGALAARAARYLAEQVHCTVSVTAGIHIDKITKEEITAIEHMAHTLITRLSARLLRSDRASNCAPCLAPCLATTCLAPVQTPDSASSLASVCAPAPMQANQLTPNKE